MSDPGGEPWSHNLNAPQIPSFLYTAEKDIFAGRFIGSILYGITIALFFQCIEALMNPINTMKRSVKWALVAHTVALFSFLTVTIGMDRYRASFTYVDGREFPGTDEYPPGPLGYEYPHFHVRSSITIYYAMFPLNQWLADGLLLYRCHVIFSMNYWVMTLSCLLYVVSVAMGIAHIYGNSFQTTIPQPVQVDIDTAYYSISLSLNVLLTLMIIVRLILHRRNIQRTLGTSNGAARLYTTVAIMLVESYALYAIALLLYIVPLALNSAVQVIFSKTLGEIQVIAPYLVILRVAKRRALTSQVITSGSDNVGSIRFKSQETTDGGARSLSDHDPASSMQANAGVPNKAGAKYGNGLEEIPL